jgi:hypothetical protein
MAKCDLVQGCHFTTDFSNKMPSQLAVIKREYCNQNFQECARYITALRLDSENVPHDLHPSDIEQADLIIKTFVG